MLKWIWTDLATTYGPLEGAPKVTPALLDQVQARCKQAFMEFRPFKGRPFALPPPLRTFYELAQDQLVPTRDGFRFYACTWLPTDGVHLAEEARGDSAPWLEIGSFADDHWVFICCDPEDDQFGFLVERANSTPWSSVVYDQECWEDLSAFLKHLTELPG